MNLEKKLKKVKGIQTLLIIVVALLLIYTILLWGDVQSAKGIAQNAHANEMAEIDTKINEMNMDELTPMVYTDHGNYSYRLDGNNVDIDTENVEPTYQVFEMKNVWREDKIIPQDATRDELLALTTEEKEHQIKVPKVL